MSTGEELYAVPKHFLSKEWQEWIGQPQGTGPHSIASTAEKLDTLEKTPLNPSVGFSQTEKNREFHDLVTRMLTQRNATHERPQPVRVKTKTSTGDYTDLDKEILVQLLQQQQQQQQQTPPPKTPAPRGLQRLEQLLKKSGGTPKGSKKAQLPHYLPLTPPSSGGAIPKKKKDQGGGGGVGIKKRATQAALTLSTPGLPFTSLFSGQSSWI